MFIDDKTDKVLFKGVKTEKQKLFILVYCNPESDTFDNATQSYKKVYNSKNENVAAVESHRMLNLPYIIESMDRYRGYIHEMNGFELDWLDNNLRNLYYKVKNDEDHKMELQTLKLIGDRIGAFKDALPDNKGIVIPLTTEQEKIAGQIMSDIMALQKGQLKDLN